MSQLTRKEFFGTLLKYAAGVVGLATVTACGGGGGDIDAAPVGNCLMNGTRVTIADNHGHVLVVSQADVTAAASKTYDIMGTADHTHNVTISAGNFGSLAGNHAINVTTTTTNAHAHNITVLCA